METVIDGAARVKGRLRTEEDLLLEGSLEGEIRSTASVRVARGGRVRGPVSARHVVVEGTVEGMIWGSESVRLAAGGRITGDVRSPHIQVEDGGVLQGRVLTEESAPVRGE
ncbi:MAG: bactofilin family protein [Acidobacteriota bacterium]